MLVGFPSLISSISTSTLCICIYLLLLLSVSLFAGLFHFLFLLNFFPFHSGGPELVHWLELIWFDALEYLLERKPFFFFFGGTKDKEAINLGVVHVQIWVGNWVM